MRTEWRNPEQTIRQFGELRAALIDASSVIYTREAGFFKRMAAIIHSAAVYSPEASQAH